MKHATLLIVEDDPGIQDMLKFSLSAEGYTLHSAFTVKAAWDTIQNKTVDLVLLDWMLPDNSGIACCTVSENIIQCYRLSWLRLKQKKRTGF